MCSMFLDDELLQIGRNVNVNYEPSVSAGIKNMIEAARNKMFEDIGDETFEEVIVPVVKRIDKTWRSVVVKLQNEGKDFVKVNGFELWFKQYFPETHKLIFKN